MQRWSKKGEAIAIATLIAFLTVSGIFVFSNLFVNSGTPSSSGAPEIQFSPDATVFPGAATRGTSGSTCNGFGNGLGGSYGCSTGTTCCSTAKLSGTLGAFNFVQTYTIGPASSASVTAYHIDDGVLIRVTNGDYFNAASFVGRVENGVFVARAATNAELINGFSGGCTATGNQYANGISIPLSFLSSTSNNKIDIYGCAVGSTTISDHVVQISYTPSQPTVPGGTNNHDPIGYSEGTDCTNIQGWTCDADNYNNQLQVHLYIDSVPGQAGARVEGAVANQNRGDLAAVCGGTTNHGYYYSLPADLRNSQQHTVRAFAINPEGGNNPELVPAGGVSSTFTCAPRCGDGYKATTEACDAGAANGQACTASCGSSCSYCTSSCTVATVTGPACAVCGDGIVQKPNGNGQNEQCDGSALAGGKCSDYGYSDPNGTLGCTGTCGYNLAGCRSGLNGACQPTLGNQCTGGTICQNNVCVNPPVGSCTSFTYSAWSACSNGQQTRTVASSSPSGCTGGSPVLTQSCTAPQGGSCTANNQCTSNNCVNGICQPGGFCDASNPCPAGNYCTSSNTCSPLINPGGSCTANSQCTSGNCQNGICVNPNGGQCTANNQCTSGNCVIPSGQTSGTCQAVVQSVCGNNVCESQPVSTGENTANCPQDCGYPQCADTEGGLQNQNAAGIINLVSGTGVVLSQVNDTCNSAAAVNEVVCAPFNLGYSTTSSVITCDPGRICTAGACLLIPGGQCTANSQCASGLCQNGVCVNPQGGNCNSNSQCASNNCQNGVCQPPITCGANEVLCNGQCQGIGLQCTGGCAAGQVMCSTGCAASCGGTGTITSCDSVISVPGTYTISNDITCTGGNGITINSSDVVINGNDHTITDSGNGIGIFINGQHDVNVSNVNVNNFDTGVYVNNSYDIHLDNVDSNGNTNTGIFWNNVDTSTLTNSGADNNGAFGIYLFNDSDNNVLTNNHANGNGNTGILVLQGSDNNQFTGNSANNNGNTGIRFGDGTGNTVSGGSANGNAYGLLLEHETGSSYSGLTLNGNTIAGIYITLGSTINSLNNIDVSNSPGEGVHIETGASGTYNLNNDLNDISFSSVSGTSYNVADAGNDGNCLGTTWAGSFNFAGAGSMMCFTNQFGEIDYTAPISGSGSDLSFVVSIAQNDATVDSAAQPGFNAPADVSLNGVSIANPVILQNGAQCPANSCTAVNLGGPTVQFSVTGWTSYSIGGITCSDSNGGVPDYFTAGGASERLGNIVSDFFDNCNGAVLTEFYCQNGRAVSTQYTCPNGCSNSACLLTAPDTSPPVISLNAPADAATLASNTVDFSWTATDVSSISCVLNLDSFSTNLVGVQSGVLANLQISGVVNGAHSWNVTCSDSASNVASSATRTFTVSSPDTTAPVVQFVSPTETDASSLARNNIEINTTASDPIADASGLNRIVTQLYFGNIPVSQISGGSPNYFNFTVPTQGIYRFNSTAFDNAGNSAFTETRTVTITTGNPSDTIAPVVTIVSPTGSYGSSTVPVSITLDEPGYCEYSIDAGLTNGTMIMAPGSTQFSASISGLANGNYVLNAYCNDMVGNRNDGQTSPFVVNVAGVQGGGGGGGGGGGSIARYKYKPTPLGYNATHIPTPTYVAPTVTGTGGTNVTPESVSVNTPVESGNGIWFYLAWLMLLIILILFIGAIIYWYLLPAMVKKEEDLDNDKGKVVPKVAKPVVPVKTAAASASVAKFKELEGQVSDALKKDQVMRAEMLYGELRRTYVSLKPEEQKELKESAEELYTKIIGARKKSSGLGGK